MMESKLLVGGKSIIDKTSEQERALEERRQQIAEQQVYDKNKSCVFYYMYPGFDTLGELQSWAFQMENEDHPFPHFQ